MGIIPQMSTNYPRGRFPFGTSDRVALTCNKDNPVARKLYENKGFQATGVEDEDEIELILTIF